jgi:hypothetical protein
MERVADSLRTAQEWVREVVGRPAVRSPATWAALGFSIALSTSLYRRVSATRLVVNPCIAGGLFYGVSKAILASTGPEMSQPTQASPEPPSADFRPPPPPLKRIILPPQLTEARAIKEILANPIDAPADEGFREFFELEVEAADLRSLEKALQGTQWARWGGLRIVGGGIDQLGPLRGLLRAFPNLGQLVFDGCKLTLEPDGMRGPLHHGVSFVSFVNCEFVGRPPVGQLSAWFPAIRYLVIPHTGGRKPVLRATKQKGLPSGDLRRHSTGYALQPGKGWTLTAFDPKNRRIEGEAFRHEACGGIVAERDAAYCSSCDQKLGPPQQSLQLTWQPPRAGPFSTLEELDRTLFGDPPAPAQPPAKRQPLLKLFPDLPKRKYGKEDALLGNRLRTCLEQESAASRPFELCIARSAFTKLGEVRGGRYPFVESLVILRSKVDLGQLVDVLEAFPNLKKLAFDRCTVTIPLWSDGEPLHPQAYFVSFAGCNIQQLDAAKLKRLGSWFPMLRYLVLPHKSTWNFLLAMDPVLCTRQKEICVQPCGHLISKAVANQSAQKGYWQCADCQKSWNNMPPKPFEPRAIAYVKRDYVKRDDGWEAKILDCENQIAEGTGLHYHPACKGVMRGGPVEVITQSGTESRCRCCCWPLEPEELLALIVNWGQDEEFPEPLAQDLKALGCDLLDNSS